jgi:AdoMet-dependent rRNA methyltransferase SPB1
MEEKRLLKEYNARPSKKVSEAKARKKRRLGKAMEKIKKKATIIAEQDINEGSKMRQIEKLYNKEKSKHKEEKSYVVNRSFNGMKGKYSAPRNVKLVDSRMKKDLKKDRARAKKEKHKGKGKGGKQKQRGKPGKK